MDTESVVLIRYDEIALKGANRSKFEKLLGRNILAQLEHVGVRPQKIRRGQGRMEIHVPWSPLVKQTLGRTFGICHFGPIQLVETHVETLVASAVEQFVQSFEALSKKARSFRVKTRRSDVAIPITSMELDREVGSQILKRIPELRVDLSNPDMTLSIEVRRGLSYLWTEKFDGVRGLPVGAQKHVLALLSGGIDSPIAALQMLKRGAHVDCVHFFGTPFVGDEVLRKIQSLHAQIQSHCPSKVRLFVVPFGSIQKEIALQIPSEFRTLIYRRLMFRIASELAAQNGHRALVTGEALGQVASQTLDNLVVVDRASRLPVLRPLVGYDKKEIIELARKYQTFETSNIPATDCCTLFSDRRPVLATTPEALEALENKLPISELILRAISLMSQSPEENKDRSSFVGRSTLRESDVPGLKDRSPEIDNSHRLPS